MSHGRDNHPPKTSNVKRYPQRLIKNRLLRWPRGHRRSGGNAREMLFCREYHRYTRRSYDRQICRVQRGQSPGKEGSNARAGERSQRDDYPVRAQATTNRRGLPNPEVHEWRQRSATRKLQTKRLRGALERRSTRLRHRNWIHRIPWAFTYSTKKFEKSKERF